jgi:hypothetical protein
MDLTKDVPRSPYEKLGGINFLPRSIDKGRAEIAGTLGEYVWRIGRSERMLEFLGIGPEDFINALRTRPTDDEVWSWVQDHMLPRTPAEIADHNEAQATAEPNKDGDTWDWPRFREFLEEIGQSHRTDIRRHFDRLDLDEGREVPHGGRTDW